MAHEMNEGVVRWAAQRAKAALEALDAHDRQTRELHDSGTFALTVDWETRTIARIDLAAQVAETSRVLVNAVLG